MRKKSPPSTVLPLIPLRGMTVFPGMALQFEIGRQKSIQALESAMKKGQEVFLTTQRDAQVEVPGPQDYFPIGCVCEIKQMLRLPGAKVLCIAQGKERAKIVEIIDIEPFFTVKVKALQEKSSRPDEETAALVRLVLSAFEEYLVLAEKNPEHILPMLQDLASSAELSDHLAANLTLETDHKQSLLEEPDIAKRLELLYRYLLEEKHVLGIEKSIDEQVRQQITQVQKEYYLKEQAKVIRRELSQEEDEEEEIEAYRQKLTELAVSERAQRKIRREISRLERLGSSSAEGNVSRTWLDTVFELPWGLYSPEEKDLEKARQILDQDHFGLEKVKERIVDYLAVKSLSDSMKGPILCLSGPPGTGKTSIARSIARASGREFVRISLGGLRDEAEIRGHRRTYIGAIPGRILNALREVKTANPVFLLDEIDKMASDFRGDPAAAMLEVLDPAQNQEFTDHYLEMPFDLSKVLFITTANSLSPIPRPLLDRMEVISLGSYTLPEKIEIAKRYLLPKQLKEHALPENFLKIEDDVISQMITSYTRESGVRSLERIVAKLSRKAARKKAENRRLRRLPISSDTLLSDLGRPKYLRSSLQEQAQIGTATGLAWTQVGGETLQIEVSAVEGSGKLELTGRLGEVMKESARLSISYIRAVADSYGIKSDFYKTKDIHIHIPEGGTPKDGPSAGVTLTSAVLSALSAIPVKSQLAMTGEITLRGRILPVGGIREKVLAAHRDGIQTVLLPSQNMADLEDVPQSVRQEITCIPVEAMSELLKIALVPKERKAAQDDVAAAQAPSPKRKSRVNPKKEATL